MGVCFIQDCGKPVLAKGLCQNHYMRQRRTGSPVGGIPQFHGLSLKARLMARVAKSTTCWEWTGGRDKRGYGRLNIGNVPHLAHRTSWEVHKGPIPTGGHILHKCDNPACVRPSHLFLGSHADNMADKMQKGRHRYGTSHGEKHGRAKLTEPQVLTILRDRKDATTYALAKEFGVSQATMWAIRHRRTWKHLNPSPH